MNPAKKFTFDTEFHADGDRKAPSAQARQKQTLTVEELEALKTLARHEGENGATSRVAAAVEDMARQVRAALAQSDAQIEALRSEAAMIALAMAKKIAPAALAALPAGDVEIALRQAMHQAIGEPRITFRAAPVVVEALKARLDEIAHEEGFEGRVLIAEDLHMTGGDCRIEWRGGGAERSEQMIEEALTNLIAHRFSNVEVPNSSDVKG